MHLLNADAVRRALPMDRAIAATRRAFAALGAGNVVAPQRTRLPIDRHDGVALVMPAYLANDQQEALAVKVASVFNGNARRGLPNVLAAVMVFDPMTGQPLALLDGATLTGIRTAAASGLATDLLARAESRRVAIFGAGVQARTHLEAICSVRKIESAAIYSPTRTKVEQLIADLHDASWAPPELYAADSPAAAVRDADIVCTTTNATDPVFADASLALGTHINAIGSHETHVSEVPPETVVRARVIVDQRTAAWQEAGDLIQPRQAGLIDAGHIAAELGELVLGQQQGRQDEDQITLFKSVGLAIQDAATAASALANAKRLNLGEQVAW